MPIRFALLFCGAALAAAALTGGPAGAATEFSAPPLPVATVAAAAGIDVRCYPTMRAYFSDSGIAPVKFWLGIAGFYGVPRSVWRATDAAPVVGLTGNACLAASRLQEGVTVARAYAAFTLSHELAHALGTADETQADCRGAAMLPQVAYRLGLRGHRAFAALRRAARRSSGYEPIPASCWAGVVVSS